MNNEESGRCPRCHESLDKVSGVGDDFGRRLHILTCTDEPKGPPTKWTHEKKPDMVRCLLCGEPIKWSDSFSHISKHLREGWK